MLRETHPVFTIITSGSMPVEIEYSNIAKHGMLLHEQDGK